ncbi:MAG: Rieske (2Fe-2S) protein [Polyangiaceae bacterium]
MLPFALTDSEQGPPQRVVDRRSVLATLAVGAVLVPLGCSATTPTSSGGSDTDGGSSTTDDAGTVATTCDNPPAGVDVGDVSSFAMGTWSLVGSSKNPFVVGQDAGGLFAYSAICTHQGCKIGKPSSTGKSVCPCHGAQFDGAGAVVKGPARSPLVHYAVALCGEHVYVDSSTTVDSSIRTPPS